MARLVRGLGWTLVVFGAVVLLYVVYLLWFTGLETERAQRDLADTFVLPQARAGDDAGDRVAADGNAADGDDQAADADDAEADPDDADEPEITAGEAYAALWFERDGERIVHDEVLYVVEGVSVDMLRAGPGHYPGTERPGGDGNLAIAGHRTTYGSPFWSLHELREGDTIHVVDRDGREWVYDYRRQQVVTPRDLWVIGHDPLDDGAATITLTTCHPRGSARQRLIAWGELRGEPIDSTASDSPIDELPET